MDRSRTKHHAEHKSATTASQPAATSPSTLSDASAIPAAEPEHPEIEMASRPQGAAAASKRAKDTRAPPPSPGAGKTEGTAEAKPAEPDALNLDELTQGMQRLSQDGQQLFATVSTVVGSARGMLLKSVSENPYGTLGAAAGVGYVLGGGLSSALTRMGAKVGARILIARVVKDMVQASGLGELLTTPPTHTSNTEPTKGE